MYANSSNAGIYYAMGITQHSNGTNHVKSIANLALMTGNVGIENAGINPLRGQNNVQGACDMGGLPNNYPGYQKVYDKEVQQKFEKAWNTRLDDNVGLSLPHMINGAYNETIKMMYVMGENPIVSDPDINHVKEAFGKLDFLVVQDLFITETAEFADVILPAASFAEKDGTFVNSDRRVLRVRKAVEAPGEAREDWKIIVDIAEQAMKEAGIKADIKPIRGGTDGSRLSYMGLPCPNIFAGGLNFHGRYEYVPIQSMEKAVKVIVNIARITAERVDA